MVQMTKPVHYDKKLQHRNKNQALLCNAYMASSLSENPAVDCICCGATHSRKKQLQANAISWFFLTGGS